MKVLLVEDDSSKANRVVNYMTTDLGANSVEVARSYKSGMKALTESIFDVAILDMTLPTFDISPSDDGGKPLIFGGRELLRQMKRRNILVPAIVTTQFEQFGSGPDLVTRDALARDLFKEYKDLFYGMVYYHATEERWKNQLSELIRTMKEDGTIRC